MPLSEFIVRNASGEQIGVVHVPLYERWGAGHIFARPSYAMSQDEVALKKTITTDSRGAHLIAAVDISKGTKFYEWRQRVQITNQNNVLVDIADYDKDGDGNPNPSVRPNTWNWALDRQSETDHEWYCSKRNRAQAVYRNEVYWDSIGRKLDRAQAQRFMLFEDNPNQPTRLLANFGPFGTFGEVKKHLVTGMPYAKEVNKEVRVKFATALIEIDNPNQPNGGRSVLRFTWGFCMNHDGTNLLYPLRRDDKH